jgi:hypothetical protein
MVLFRNETSAFPKKSVQRIKKSRVRCDTWRAQKKTDVEEINTGFLAR